MDVFKKFVIGMSILSGVFLGSCGPKTADSDGSSLPDFANGISGGQLGNDPADPAYWSVVHLKRKTVWKKEETIVGGKITSISTFTIDCTAALLEKDIIISAAHCLNPEDRSGPEGFTFVDSNLFAEFVQIPGLSILVTATLVHPEYRGDAKDPRTYLNNDLALLKLQTAAPAPLKSVALYTQDLMDGQSLNTRRYGFGITNKVNPKAFAPGEVIPEQSKQDNILRRVDGPGSVRKAAKRLIYNAKALNAGTCPGDSGGPNFTYVNGVPYLAGVNSSYDLSSEKDLCRGRNTSILLTEYLDWIGKGVAKLKSPHP